MAEALPSMIWTATPEGVVDYVNHVFEDYTGNPANQGGGIDWLGVVHPNDREAAVKVWTSSVSCGTPYQTEFRIIHKPSNTYRWHHVAATPHLGSDGKVRRWFGITTDIHERIIAQTAANHANRELRQQVALRTVETKVLDAISQERDLIEILDIVSHSIDQLIPNANVSILLVEDGRLVHGAASGLPADYVKAVDGLQVGEGVGSCGSAAARKAPVFVTDILADPLWAPYQHLAQMTNARACWSTPVLDAQRNVMALFGIYCPEPQSPTTEQRAIIDHFCQFVRVAMERTRQRERARHLELQLRSAQRRETVVQLTGGLAHDFNNLLTVILGNAGQLTDELPPDTEHQELAEAIKSSARKGAGLIRSLLSFARQHDLQPKPVHVNELLAGMHDLLQRLLGSHISFTLDLHQGSWLAFIDPAQLENALLNLVFNARDALGNSGSIAVRTANLSLNEHQLPAAGLKPGDYILLQVQDTGTGIDPSTLERIFDPFFTTKEVGQGSGLGLSMVHGFARQSDGAIMVDSTLGQGTTVSLYLPRHIGTGIQQAPQEQISLQKPTGVARVLLVEDDQGVQSMLTRQLKKLGYDVCAASNGHEGLEHLNTDPAIELLFTDMMMPGGMDGFELATLGRQNNPLLRVILSSGYSDKLGTDKERTPEGFWVLPKPYLSIDLAKLLDKALASPP